MRPLSRVPTLWMEVHAYQYRRYRKDRCDLIERVLVEFRLDDEPEVAKGSMTQPFPDRRHTRSGNDGTDDDQDAFDRYKPHRLYPGCPCGDHNGQNYGADNEPVGVHPPGKQATQLKAHFVP